LQTYEHYLEPRSKLREALEEQRLDEDVFTAPDIGKTICEAETNVI
jgi:hypothetical protein